MSREIINISVNKKTEKDILEKLNTVNNKSDYIKSLIRNDIYRDNKLYDTLDRLVYLIENEKSFSKNNYDDSNEQDKVSSIQKNYLEQFD